MEKMIESWPIEAIDVENVGPDKKFAVFKRVLFHDADGKVEHEDYQCDGIFFKCSSLNRNDLSPGEMNKSNDRMKIIYTKLVVKKLREKFETIENLIWKNDSWDQLKKMLDNLDKLDEFIKLMTSEVSLALPSKED